MTNGNGTAWLTNTYRALLLLAVSIIGYFLAGLHSELKDATKQLRGVEMKVIGVERDVDWIKEQVRDLQARQRPQR